MPTPVPPPGPLEAALERIGDRWSPRLVEVLLAGPLRYGELQAAIAGIAPNILADRLRRLEADGLLTSTAYEERPPRFEYRLTAEGRALAGALRLLADWGARHGRAADGPEVAEPGDAGRGADAGEHVPMRHADCGTSLEARWFCPTCDVVVEADPVEGLRHL